MVEKSIIEIIKKYLELLKDEGVIIDRAFLYGSYAKNQFNSESDIDLMLVSGVIDSSNDNIIGKIWALTQKVNSRIEPFLVSADNFYNDDVSPIIQLVRDEGIEIA